jgi:hypothetical protein
MAEKEEKDKKIIIDEDWKNQAHKEKEKLAEQEKSEKGKGKKESRQLPKGDFLTLVSMLVTQALFSLGLIHPEGESPDGGAVNLELARINIEMLDSLAEKTKGNLTDDEKKMLENSLNELRIAYVKIAGV